MVPDRLGDAPTNQLGNARSLSNPSERTIVQPNNDTLYTLGHLDLRGGPLVLHVPKSADRRAGLTWDSE